MIWLAGFGIGLGALYLLVAGISHIGWALDRFNEDDWPWSWRLLMPTFCYIDWRYDHLDEWNACRAAGGDPHPRMRGYERGIVAFYFGLAAFVVAIAALLLRGAVGWSALDLSIGLFDVLLGIYWMRRFRRNARERAKPPAQPTTINLPAGLSFRLVPVSNVPPGLGYTSFTMMSTTPRKPLPVEQRAEPFTGWKQARVVCHGGELCFQAYNGVQYGLDARAECATAMGSLVRSLNEIMGRPTPSVSEQQTHRSPEPSCQCGFYAFKTHPGAIEAAHPQMDLGRAILEVELFGRVIEAERGYRAERMRVLSVEFSTECYGCEGRASGLVMHDGQMVPACSSCVPIALGSLADVASLLGTEVRWMKGEKAA